MMQIAGQWQVPELQLTEECHGKVIITQGQDRLSQVVPILMLLEVIPGSILAIQVQGGTIVHLPPMIQGLLQMVAGTLLQVGVKDLHQIIVGVPDLVEVVAIAVVLLPGQVRAIHHQGLVAAARPAEE